MATLDAPRAISEESEGSTGESEASESSDSSQTPMPALTQAAQTARNAVALAANAFSVRLYQAVKAEGGNLVISPLSAAVLLALTRHGAAGTTEQQLATALQLNSSREETAVGYGALLDSLQISGKAVLRTANGLFAQKGFRLKDDFRQAASGSFRAGAEELDFENDTEAARRAINQWAEQSTDGRIQDLFQPGAIEPTTRVVLANAIYFKAGWCKTFEESNTSMKPFHVSNTLQVNVPTMIANFQLNYGILPAVDAIAVELPYMVKNTYMSMVIMLPNSVDGLERLESSFEQLDFDNLTPEFGEVIISLPKIKIESTYNLKKNLQQLGITEVFERGADLSGVAEEPLCVDDVVQKTFIGVDEKGTEAAVATGANWFLCSRYETVYFKADHPFLFIIKKENTIIFLGRVANPSI